MLGIVVELDILLRGRDASANGDPRRMYRLGRAGNERVPPSERAAFGPQPVGAGRRQPSERPRQVRRQFQTISDAPPAPGIVAAAAGLRVEEPASDIGEMHNSRILVLELDQTATAAAVAEALPFRRIKRLERLPLPKGSCRARTRFWLVSHVRKFGRGCSRRCLIGPESFQVTSPPSLSAGLWTGHKIANIAGSCSGSRTTAAIRN